MIVLIHKDKLKQCVINQDTMTYHNSYGPTYLSDPLMVKEYCIDGELHNPHGLAHSDKYNHSYYLNGVKYTKEEWEKRRHDY